VEDQTRKLPSISTCELVTRLSLCLRVWTVEVVDVQMETRRRQFVEEAKSLPKPQIHLAQHVRNCFVRIFNCDRACND
jgi:hypothetical protein